MTPIASISVGRAVTGGTSMLLRGRTLLALLAVAFGVALGYAVEVINRAALNELAASLSTLTGQADLQVRGPRGGFDEAIYPRLARLDGVAVASPVVEVAVGLRPREDPLTLIGVDVFRAAAVNPALVGASRDRLDTLRPGTVFVSPSAATWLHLNEGDVLSAPAGNGEVSLRVAATTVASSSARYAVMDIAAVQDAFGYVGRLTRIDLRVAPGVDTERLRERIATLLPPGLTVTAPDENLAATERLSRAYRVNLNVLALVALFTGSMLVFATQTLALARRRPQFALLRTLGLTKRRLVSWVIGEAALLGIVGAGLGIAAGHAFAWAALRQFGPDLGAGFFRGEAITLRFEPGPTLVFAALGILACIAGSALPAREAARAAPAAALKASDADFSPDLPAWPAWLSIAIGAALTLVPPVHDLPLFGYFAIAFLIIGAILAMPQVANHVLRSLRVRQNIPARLAIDYLRASPGRVAAMLAAMVASVSLMVAMAIMVVSFRQSLLDWLGVMLPADLYIRAASETVSFDEAQRARLRATTGIARAEFMRVTSVVLDATAPRIALLARDIDPHDPAARLALVGEHVVTGPNGPPPAWITEQVAEANHLAVGSTFELPLRGRNVAFTVAGVWRDYARQQGAIVIERSRYVELTGDDSVNEAALWLTPGTSASAVDTAVVTAAGGSSHVMTATPGELRRLSLAAFDRTFAVTYALEAAAVLIGLVGLSATLVAQTLARSREFGMLRHIGMTRAQLRSMLAIEGGVLATIGALSGLILGFIISLILVHVVNRQSFHWGMNLHVPVLPLAALSIALVLLGTLTARASAQSATSISAVRAVREDW